MNHGSLVTLTLLVIVGLAGCQTAGRSCCHGRAPGVARRSQTGDLGSLTDFKRTRAFNPSRYPEGNWRPRGLCYEDVWFCSADGTRLHGWYVPHAEPRATVLYCHGNSGNVSDRADVLRVLHERVAVSVFIFDYRGFGRSGGRPAEEGVLADARAARRWLARRAGVAEQEIVLLGHALGSGVAVDLAARDGARALILESAFTSVPDVGASYFPRLPIRLLARTELDSAHKIRRYHGPLLQSHGDADTIVPYPLGRRLYSVANQPKEFVTLHGHDHMDPMGTEYYGKMSAFLDSMNALRGAESDIADAKGRPTREAKRPN
jgi:fermentation-respiration switch protein FrsA (DUF1100 family)